MAFNLFLASIPMMAFAGWLIAQVLRQSPEALSSMSLLLDLTPTEMHNIILRHVGRFSAGAVAPFALTQAALGPLRAFGGGFVLAFAVASVVGAAVSLVFTALTLPLVPIGILAGLRRPAVA